MFFEKKDPKEELTGIPLKLYNAMPEADENYKLLADIAEEAGIEFRLARRAVRFLLSKLLIERVRITIKSDIKKLYYKKRG